MSLEAHVLGRVCQAFKVLGGVRDFDQLLLRLYSVVLGADLPWPEGLGPAQTLRWLRLSTLGHPCRIEVLKTPKNPEGFRSSCK